VHNGQLTFVAKLEEFEPGLFKVGCSSWVIFR
jgi:hypothetical protein